MMAQRKYASEVRFATAYCEATVERPPPRPPIKRKYRGCSLKSGAYFLFTFCSIKFFKDDGVSLYGFAIACNVKLLAELLGKDFREIPLAGIDAEARTVRHFAVFDVI